MELLKKDKKIILLFTITILLAMLANVAYSYLWGPDEPRIAEIAREAFYTGNYITPHLCGVPFIEKPPLYYDLISLSYWIFNGPSAGSARLVSAICGILTLVGVFSFGLFWKNIRTGLLSVLFLIIMPQFYRSTHLILIDNGVNLFCTWAIILFAFFIFKKSNTFKKSYLYIFYFLCALAFLTKGVICIAIIGVILLAYILFTKNWNLLKCMLSPLPLLMFFIPVLIWVYLFYQQGGLDYLNLLFVNNTIGRLLHISFKVSTDHLRLVDVGSTSPWFFYLDRAPAMFGAIIVFVPFIIIDFCSRFLKNDTLKKLTSKDSSFSKPLKSILNFIFIKKTKDSDEKNIKLLVFIWAFVPIIALSFSEIKEVTYILPCYCAIALLASAWIDERIEKFYDSDKSYSYLIYFFYFTIPAIILTQFTSLYFYKTSLFLVIAILIIIAIILVYSLFKKQFLKVIYLVALMSLIGVILGNTPSLLIRSRRSRKCFTQMADYAWSKVGNRKLYIYRGRETLMGTIPFCGNKTTPLVSSVNQLFRLLESKSNIILLPKGLLSRLKSNPKYSHIIQNMTIIKLPFDKLIEKYVLIKG
ncbi:MAG: glycosyltransferase family 39 protein [bacterium]|nr:glycosyltransferase family 39 protein [bacterium]